MMIDAHRYDVSVRRRDIEGDALFEASVVELPDVSAYADTYQEAYELVIASIRDLAAHAESDGRSFPQPRDDRDDEFSGRVTLRLPKRMHRLAVTAAKVQSVSLNHYLSTVISRDVTRQDTLDVVQECAANIWENFRALEAVQKDITAPEGSYHLILARDDVHPSITTDLSGALTNVTPGPVKPIDLPKLAHG